MATAFEEVPINILLWSNQFFLNFVVLFSRMFKESSDDPSFQLTKTIINTTKAIHWQPVML